jgi:hypothetical protein
MRTTVILFITLFTLVCCFEPDGEHFVNVTSPATNNIKIDLAVFKDTIFVYNTAQVSFVYQGKPTIKSYEVFVDDSLQGKYIPYYKEFSFNLDGYSIGSGVYQLRVIAIAKSNSGSLADKLDAEEVNITKKFTLVVDVTKPEPRTVSFDSTGGVLRVSWSPYLRKDFVRYQLRKNCFFYDCNPVEIFDRTQCEYVDHDFLGGTAYYAIDVITVNDYVSGIETGVNSQLGTTVELQSDNKIKLTFTRPTFTPVNAIEVYQQNVLIKTITDFSDNVLYLDNNFKFGTVYRDAFSIILKSENTNIQSRQDIPFVLGKSILNFYESLLDVTYNDKRKEYFTEVWNNGNGFRYLTAYDADFKRLKEQRYLMAGFSLSEDGEKCLATIYDTKNALGFFSVNPATLDTTRIFAVPKDMSFNSLQLSNNKLYCVRETYERYSLVRTDGPTVWISYGVGSVYALSADGKYYYADNKIYEISSSNILTEIRQIAPRNNTYFSGFRNDKPNELMIVNPGMVRVINVVDGTERSINFTFDALPNKIYYDDQSGWLLYATYGYNNVMINIETGESFIVPAVNNVNFMLANSQIFSSDGYVADINFIRSLAQ